MIDVSDDFGPFNGRVWLNTASEGALPRLALEALHEAGQWKVAPYQLTLKRFREVPSRLKKAIGRLLHVADDDVILGNSATYGIHLLANGLTLQPDDEIVVMQNDFPTDILPWLGLTKRGIKVKQILPSSGSVLSVSDLTQALTPKTCIVCLPHVHTFSGAIVDVKGIGRVCQDKNIIFVVNISQSAGAMPIDVSEWPVDAITSAAFKWLCGPYGTGFCWMKSELRKQLQYNQSYWGNVLDKSALDSSGPLQPVEDDSSRRYDVFGTANFFNFYPLAVAIEYLQKVGIPDIQVHNDDLVEQAIKGLISAGYRVISPHKKGERSGLVFFSHSKPNDNSKIFEQLLAQGIYPALWKGNLRVAPHLFNTPQDIEKLISVLKKMS